jgi:hypothetical protein
MRVLFAISTALLVAAITAVLVFFLHRTPLGPLLRKHIPDRPQRRLFVASLGFFFTFGAVRTLTFAIHNSIGPFHDVQMGGRHIHHLVWGILLLLLVGYGWLMDVGTGTGSSSIMLSRTMSVLYGAGAALTLDEFALWLNLRDVYWAQEGRASVDAAIMFGTFLVSGLLGRKFLLALANEARKLFKK